MKLYYIPAACPLASHITACEAGLPLEIEKVDTKNGYKTETGEDYLKINPKGYVPALRLDNGEILTECLAVMQYLGDQAPEKGLTPAAGSFARYRLEEWLSFMNSELQKSFGPLFKAGTTEAGKEQARAILDQRLAYMNEHMATNTFVMGDHFTVADAYLFTILGWPAFVGYDLAPFPHLQAFAARIGQRPGVQKALREEGLLG